MRLMKFATSWLLCSLQWYNMGAMMFQITGNLIVCLIVFPQVNIKENIKALHKLPCVWGIHMWLVDSLHIMRLVQKALSWYDVILFSWVHLLTTITLYIQGIPSIMRWCITPNMSSKFCEQIKVLISFSKYHEIITWYPNYILLTSIIFFWPSLLPSQP